MPSLNALAPLLFVVLWSTGFVGAKFGLPYAERLTFLLWRYVLILLLMTASALLMRAPWPRGRRQVFHIAKAGTVAGCTVVEGKITRKAQVRLVRDSVVVFTGKLSSLRRFKEDASEVTHGYECGITIDGYGDVKEKDIIEAFDLETMAATLDAAITDKDKPNRR